MATSNSTIRFSLKANCLRGQETSPFKAQVRAYKTMNREEMIADMVEMNASVSRQEILVVLDLMQAVIISRSGGMQFHGNREILQLI